MMARVSSKNPKNANLNLISYLIRNRHWSPFEMVSMCLEIHTTRTIARQMIRHRSFTFQEFSQRYAKVMQKAPIISKARRQDTKNRQNSIDDMGEEDRQEFERDQQALWDMATRLYHKHLDRGVAKEQARVFLPEGMTETRLHMHGSIRSWLHYCASRSAEEGAQNEHAELAKQCFAILDGLYPTVCKAYREAFLK